MKKRKEQEEIALALQSHSVEQLKEEKKKLVRELADLSVSSAIIPSIMESRLKLLNLRIDSLNRALYYLTHEDAVVEAHHSV